MIWKILHYQRVTIALRGRMCTILLIYIISSIARGDRIYLSAPERYASTRPSSASHLEEDVSDPSQLLASYVGSLGFIRGNDRSPHYIVGGGTKGYREGVGQNAQFDEITGFAQVNSNQVLIADHGNNCIRMVDRQQRSATTAAGQCRNSGWRDGRLLESKFDQPYNIIRYTDHSFLVTDHNNHAIREINLQSGLVSTLLKTEDNLYFPIAMAIDRVDNRLYVTLRYTVVFIDLESKQIQELSRDRGDKIALIRQEEVIITQNPRDYNKRGRRSVIKQLDISNNRTTEQDLIVWPTPHEQPLSLYLNKSGNTIYISERDVIRSVKIINRTEATTASVTQPNTPVTLVTVPTTAPAKISTSQKISSYGFKSANIRKPVGGLQGVHSTTMMTFPAASPVSTTSSGIGVTTHIYLVIPSALLPALIVIIVVATVYGCRKRLRSKLKTRNYNDSVEVSTQNQTNENKNDVYQWLIRSPDDAPYATLHQPITSNYEEIGPVSQELIPLQGTSSSSSGVEYTSCHQTDELVKPSHPVQPTDEASMFGSRRSVFRLDDDDVTDQDSNIDEVTSFHTNINHNIVDFHPDIRVSATSRVDGILPRLETSIAFEEHV